MTWSWPSCGAQGCTSLAIMKWETIEDGHPISVFLCFSCISEIRECLAAIADVREQERLLLEKSESESSDLLPLEGA